MTPALERDLLALYEQLDEEIARDDPQCRACGECCDFPEQGYELFATTAEAALVVSHERQPDSWRDTRLCPFHVDGKCANRRCRPLGCRTYFCDDSFHTRGPVLYGKYHDLLKAILERHGHEYRYGLFMELLADAWANNS